MCHSFTTSYILGCYSPVMLNVKMMLSLFLQTLSDTASDPTIFIQRFGVEHGCLHTSGCTLTTACGCRCRCCRCHQRMWIAAQHFWASTRVWRGRSGHPATRSPSWTASTASRCRRQPPASHLHSHVNCGLLITTRCSVMLDSNDYISNENKQKL